jgi:hypothetical protein
VIVVFVNRETPMKAGRKGSPWLAVVAWGLVLAMGGLARAAGDETAATDVNWAEPNEARLFSTTWRYASSYATLGNPAEDQAAAVTRTLILSIRIPVDPLGKVFGLSNMLPVDAKAATETGAELVGQKGLPGLRTYSALSGRNDAAMTLRFPVDPNRGYPVLLKEVSWTGYALLYRQEQWIDVPFEVTGQWVQITPGVRVKFTQAALREGTYEYVFEGQYPTQTSPFESGKPGTYAHQGGLHVYADQPLPPCVITQIELLDAEGWTIQPLAQYTSSRHFPKGTSTCTGGGMGLHSGEVKTMRFWVLTDPYEIKLPFVLTDVLVPTL